MDRGIVEKLLKVKTWAQAQYILVSNGLAPIIKEEIEIEGQKVLKLILFKWIDGLAIFVDFYDTDEELACSGLLADYVALDNEQFNEKYRDYRVYSNEALYL